MHQNYRFLLLPFAVAGIVSTGCATNATKETPAEYRVGTPTYISTALPPDKLKSAQYSVPNSYFGVSSPPSGSLALGILLGPIGALINAESQSISAQKSTGSMSILSEDIAAMLSDLRPNYAKRAPGSDGSPSYFLTPTASLYYKTETTFTINCTLYAQLNRGSESVWSSRYVINREKEYSRDDTALNERLRDDLKQCFSSAVSLFELHKERGASILREYEIEFVGRTAVFPVVESLLPNRLVYFDSLGLYDLDRGYWRGVKQK